MKYVFMTEPNSAGISEVFHRIDLPEDKVPAGMIERWNTISDASPIQVLTVSGKENLAIESTYDETSGEFTMSSEVPQEAARATNQTVSVFLVENKVMGMFSSTLPGSNIPNSKLLAAFADPIIVKGLPDEDPVDLGYTWDGTSFTAPTDI